jgi:hypothetical protein
MPSFLIIHGRFGFGLLMYASKLMFFTPRYPFSILSRQIVTPKIKLPVLLCPNFSDNFITMKADAHLNVPCCWYCNCQGTA